jgi:aryl-alcohol dehydrogenase-like predicted oxidoreductase
LPKTDDDRAWRIVDAVRAVAKEAETTPAAVALAWLLTKPEVTSVITGVRSIAQLESNAAACDLTLSPSQLARLEDASSFDLGYPYGFIKHIQGRL